MAKAKGKSAIKRPIPRITEERIAFLASIIVPEYGEALPSDLVAAALIELVASIVHEDDGGYREHIGTMLEVEAYRRTDDCGKGVERFYRAAYAGSVDAMVKKLRRRNRA